ncbi:hypothetical protein LZC95_51435 [Pendulispora brunnea]|uniref:Uncharacterized protein n=1 Tax=Pendulispora brunnea TaxID=2905690 RepID=A0ABZ2KD84_9BACT
MKHRTPFTLFVLAAVAVLGCSTTFQGSSRIKEGAAGCRVKCEAQGLDFAGMVFMGSYTEGCICQERGRALALTDAASAAGSVIAVQSQTDPVHQPALYSPTPPMPAMTP